MLTLIRKSFSKFWRSLFIFQLPEIPAYGLLYFDQLRSEKKVFETVSVKGKLLISGTDKKTLDDIDAKREAYRQQTGDESQYLTWQDIYTYELILLKYRDFEDLKGKILSLRTKYRNVAGQKEYDIYLASKPPDLAAITNPQDQMNLLRGDLEYLFREFFSLYAYMTAREQLRSKILVGATLLTLAALIAASIFATFYPRTSDEATVGSLLTRAFQPFGYSRTSDEATGPQSTNSAAAAKSATAQTTNTGPAASNVNSANTNNGANVNTSPDASPDTVATTPRDVDSTIGEEGKKDRGISILSVVIFAGVMGAFVSMHQRIQSSPSEGDPVYTFSMLMHGWFSIFISPVSGAVFAVVLYLFFSGQLLTGKIFPKINTYVAPTTTASPSPSRTPSPAPPAQSPALTPRTANTPAGGATASNPTAAQSLTPSNTPQGERASATTPPPSGEPIGLYKFLKSTGPEAGVDFALLVIWSFIAGFAERFVPDTLSRLISRNEAANGRRV